MQAATVNRWYVGTDAFGEGGSNTGTNFAIINYSDTGTLIGTVRPMTIYRSNGVVAIANAIVSGTLTAPTVVGNATTATSAINLSTTQINWSTNGTISAVVGLLAWKNYGNYHTIFDASANTSPSGGALQFGRVNAEVPWSETFPTLMGWNTGNTYGVRVDSTRSLSGGPVAATTITATGDITAFSTSDNRLKTNIIKIDNAIDKVNKISGITFDWTEEARKSRQNEEEVFGNRRETGVIAQEVEEVLPEVVIDRVDGYKAVRYEKIVPLLIEAIKDLSGQVDDVKQQIKELEEKS